MLSSLLYGQETRTLYARHIRRLNSFCMRCLHKILEIKWEDKIPNRGAGGLAHLKTAIKKRKLQ